MSAMEVRLKNIRKMVRFDFKNSCCRYFINETAEITIRNRNKPLVRIVEKLYNFNLGTQRITKTEAITSAAMPATTKTL